MTITPLFKLDRTGANPPHARYHLTIAGIEIWRYMHRGNAPRFAREDWQWHDSKMLHKRFVRIGRRVYCFAWYTRQP